MADRSLISLMAAGIAPVTKASGMGMATDMRALMGRVHEPFPGAWQRNMELDNQECMLAFAAVYACVTRIANDIAKLRIKLVEQNDSGIWVEVQRNSPHLPVLTKPNRYQTRIQFLVEWIVMKLLHGNVYILKERDGRGIVVAMYVLDSRRVKPVIAMDGGIYYQLATATLAGQPSGGIVRASEIIHDRCPTLWHPLCGVSPIYACASSATQGNRIQSNSAKFFHNQSRPGGVLVVPGDIDEPQFNRLKTEWNSGEHTGRTAVLTNGTKYEPFTMPAQDAQLIEQLRWTVEDVARAFAMPLYKIGAGPVPSNNNVEALQQQYYSDCLQVLIESVELCLDEGLNLTTADTARPLGVELDLEGLIRMDTSAQVEMLTKAAGGAWMKIDEAREKRNLGPVSGGNTIYKQHQDYSIEALAKRDAQPDPFAAAQPPAPPEEEPPTPDDEPEVESAKAVQLLLEKTIADARATSERAAAAEAREQAALAALNAASDPTEVKELADALLAGFESLEVAHG